MRAYKGSFTIEAACVFPIILFCICITMDVGIAFYLEIKQEAMSQMENEKLDLISVMYRRELVKELFEEEYED
ncbi:MAG: pilus assembly protein [Roseburia sp.]|nr:pilus assembly protein [Roseburia sp.]